MIEDESSQNFQTKIAQTATNIEKQKRLKEKLKINNEVTRWALGYQYEADLNVDSDDSLDDSYLDELGGMYKTREEFQEAQEKKKAKMSESRNKVRELLANLRRRSLTRSVELKKINPYFNKNNNLIQCTILENNPSESKIDLFNLIQSSNFETGLGNSEEEVEETEEMKAKKDKKISKPLNNKISRAVPGIVQQNITIERVLYKDLLKLSKQRYIVKQGMEFKEKQFLDKQEKKGLAATFPGSRKGSLKIPTLEDR